MSVYARKYIVSYVYNLFSTPKWNRYILFSSKKYREIFAKGQEIKHKQG